MQPSIFDLFKLLYDIPITFLIKCSKHDPRKYFNPSQASVVFHTETSYLIYTANQMTGFYMKCNSGLKWVNSTCRILINGWVWAFSMYLWKYTEHVDESNGWTFALCTYKKLKQETIYYIQETKTIFKKFFTLILKRNRNL